VACAPEPAGVVFMVFISPCASKPDDAGSTLRLRQPTDGANSVSTIAFEHDDKRFAGTTQSSCNLGRGTPGDVAKVGDGIAGALRLWAVQSRRVSKDGVPSIAQGIDQASIEIGLGSTRNAPARNVILVGNANNRYIHAFHSLLLAILPYGRLGSLPRHL